MKVINKLEYSTTKNNKKFHNDFQKLQKELKIITTFYSTSIENYQQHCDKQGKQLPANKQDNTITSLTQTSHQLEELKTQ